MTIDRDPPRVLERILHAALGSSPYRDDILGDLHEAFVSLQAQHTVAYARWWYGLQAARLAVRYALRTRPRVHTRGHMDRLVTQIRFAVRSLVKRPWMTAAVVSTLALGIGANAAIFGVVDALILHPYAFPDVDRIVMPVETAPSLPYRRQTVSPANFLDWRRDLAGTIDHLTAIQWWDVNLVGRDEAERVLGFHVSPGFFAALGVEPAVGRGFLAEEEVRGRDRVVVLSDGLWRRRFGGDPAIIGQLISIDGALSKVVGIAPRGFDFPMGTELWAPLSFDLNTPPSRSNHFLTVLGRLAPGRSLGDARARLVLEAQRIARDFPDDAAGESATVYTLTRGMIDLGLGPILSLWQAAALFVLLIACANIINLLLARGAERGREMAVRVALGCSRGRLILESLVESAVLVAMAAPLSIGVASVSLSLIQRFMPPRIARFVAGWNALHIDARLIAVTLAIGAATAILFGSLPALQFWRGDAVAALKSDGRVGPAPGRQRLRRALVVAEVALVLPLLVAALLGVKSVQRCLTGWLGYEPSGMLTLKVALPSSRYADADAERRFTTAALDGLVEVPGVVGALAINQLPSSGSSESRRIEVDSQPATDSRSRLSARYRAVSHQYFELMKVPIVAGRPFSTADRAETAPVAIVSESFARTYWGSTDVIGRRVRIFDKPWMTIVGVCGDLIHDWFDERNAPTLYRPITQDPQRDFMMALRASVEPTSLVPSVRRAFATIDPSQPIFDVMTMRQMVGENTIGLQYVAAIMGAFAALALVLAIVGLYAIMSYLVAQRVREIGVRIALGATSRDVLRLALAQAARLTATGVSVGLALSLLLSRAMEAGLVGVIETDTVTTTGLAAALAATGLAASYLPAHRAAAVDPIAALRCE